MARPTKNSCDYFPHDIGMRDHKKIKAIRQKFGIVGYAVWVMFLELLTGSDGNVFEDSELEIELISGDFGVSVTEIREILDYCYRLELLFLKDGFVSSESLDERLLPVYQKRKINKELSAKQKRKNGKFDSNSDENIVSDVRNSVNNVIIGAEMPQSKVKESKVNNSKEYSYSDILKIYSNKSYESQIKEIKEKFTKSEFESYLWFLSLFEKFKNRLSKHEFPLLSRYRDDIYLKFKKEEIEAGAKKLQSLGINANADFVFRLIDCIGYSSIKQNGIEKTDPNLMNDMGNFVNIKPHLHEQSQSFKVKQDEK